MIAMADKKQKYDMNSPEAKAVTDEIVHGTFMMEGTAVAFPLCFPGASTPIPLDESKITALDVSPEGMVYGGTSGYAAHLFVGMFHGVTGMVFDLGTVPDADKVSAVVCGSTRVVACVNGKSGGRLVAFPFQPLPFDLIQEWGFSRPALTDLGSPVAGEPIVHAVASQDRKTVVGITFSVLFTLNVESGAINVVGAVPGAGRLACTPGGVVLGKDEGASLFRYEIATGALSRSSVNLPSAGSWENSPNVWARDAASGRIYFSDDQASLYALESDGTIQGPLAKARVAPITSMAVTFDGRVFGSCGDGIGRLWRYNPRQKEIKDLGVAVSVLERRRYGYEFAAAAIGRDGQVYFGENDNLGHLWIYFPRVEAVG